MRRCDPEGSHAENDTPEIERVVSVSMCQIKILRSQVEKNLHSGDPKCRISVFKSLWDSGFMALPSPALL